MNRSTPATPRIRVAPLRLLVQQLGQQDAGVVLASRGVEGQFRIERGRVLLDPQAEDARQLGGQRRHQVPRVAAVDRYQMEHAHGVVFPRITVPDRPNRIRCAGRTS